MLKEDKLPSRDRREKHITSRRVKEEKESIKLQKKELKEQKRQVRHEKFDKSVSYLSSNTSSLLGSIIIILVAVAMIRVLYNGSADTVSFGSLLNLLESAPQVSTGVKNFVQQLQFTEPWVILDAVRTFINLNLQAVSIVIWLSSSLIDVCIFISYFLLWLFV